MRSLIGNSPIDRKVRAARREGNFQGSVVNHNYEILTQKKTGEKTAPPLSGSLVQDDLYLVLSPIAAFSAPPISSAYFLPAKRTSVSDGVLELRSMTAASLPNVLLSSTTFAGAFVTTFFPCMKLTSTFDPVPSQRNW